MTIDIKPETEKLVREEIKNGHFQTVDDLIVQAIHAWRERSQREISPVTSAEARLAAATRIRELRQGVRLERGPVSLREYAHLGHLY
jgi:Arc/MetJ-type ribon-helix-helix transcriptional regulator